MSAVNCALCDHPIPPDASISAGKVRCPSCGCETRAGDDGALRVHGAFAASDTIVGPASLDPAPAPTVPSDQAPEIPGYEFLALLGKGGMGTVYRARQLALDRVVAMKLLSYPFASDPTFVLRFEREAKAMASFSHPNVTAVFDRGNCHGRPYFAMELVDGRPLRSLLTEAGGKLPQGRGLRLMLQVVEALAYVHSKGTIHRDIKPENILVTAGDLVKVTDFGLAAVMDAGGAGLTQSNVAMGTLHYMAPEQTINARAADLRADVYSFGVTLHEILTGGLPVGRWLPPHQLDGSLDPRLDQVVVTCLQPDREQRYPGMEAIREILSEVLRAPLPTHVLANRDAIDALDLDPEIDDDTSPKPPPAPMPVVPKGASARPRPPAPASTPARAAPTAPLPPAPPRAAPSVPASPPLDRIHAPPTPSPLMVGGVPLPPPRSPLPASPQMGAPSVPNEDIAMILERAREKEARGGLAPLRSPPTRIQEASPPPGRGSRLPIRLAVMALVLGASLFAYRSFEPSLAASIMATWKRSELEAGPPGFARDLKLKVWALARDRGLAIARTRPGALASSVASSDATRAKIALAFLSGSPLPQAVVIITRGLEHQDPSVAETAVRALVKLASPEAVAALERIASSAIPGRSELARVALAGLAPKASPRSPSRP